MKLKVGPDRVIDFRVSTLPTLFGEKIVIRILDPSSAKLGIDALGYEPEEKERLLHAIGRPYGMILVTGPTGSEEHTSELQNRFALYMLEPAEQAGGQYCHGRRSF